MKTPITENEEYLERWLDFKKKNESSQPYCFIVCSQSYHMGATTAQSILQKEHDKEMVEFAKWIDYYAYTDMNDEWNVPTVGKLTIQQLLELFRKDKAQLTKTIIENETTTRND